MVPPPMSARLMSRTGTIVREGRRLRHTVAQRLATLPILLLGVSLIVFLLGRVVPGDPARVLAGSTATEVDVERLRAQYGLDRPLPEQYLNYLERVLRGDLGDSILAKRPVSAELGDRLPATIELTLAALLIGVPIGLGLGIAAARRQNSAIDYVATLSSILGLSLPLFWVGLMLAWVLGVALKWLPFTGRLSPFAQLPTVTGIATVDALLAGNGELFVDAIQHLLLPAITLSLIPIALIARLTRASFIEVLAQDFMRTARAYGLPERTIVWRYAARNALLPLITLFGVMVPALLSGAVLTETVFAWPGVGTLVLKAISSRDYAVIQSVTLLFAVLYVLSNLLVDLSYGLLDPRTRQA
jgi:ABC-type dipeptide/oligopeptide/nickel transport system permease component